MTVRICFFSILSEDNGYSIKYIHIISSGEKILKSIEVIENWLSIMTIRTIIWKILD